MFQNQQISIFIFIGAQFILYPISINTNSIIIHEHPYLFIYSYPYYFLFQNMIGSRPIRLSKLKPKGSPFEGTSSDFPKSQANIIETQSQQFSILCNQLSQLLGTLNQQNPKYLNEKQDRDFPVHVQIPVLPKNETDRRRQIQRWLTQLCGQVFSTSFNMFETKKLTEKETKVYCSENLLRHILLLTKKNVLDGEDFELINGSLKKTISYYLLKYPQSMGTEINKKLLKEILSTNVLDSNANNILFESGIQFNYREDGMYNDSIMKFVNHLLELINQKDNEGKSRFQRFEDMFEKIFTGPEEKAWVDSFNPNSYEKQNLLFSISLFERKLKQARKSIAKNEQQHKKAEDYQNKVRSYSKYIIGTKISENTPDYSEDEIESGNIKAKSAPILRILTKWCEQLENKYFDEDYFLNKDEDIIQQKGGQTVLSTALRKKLTELIQSEKENIKDYLQNIQKNNFQNQNKNNYSKLIKGENHHISEEEKVIGKFIGKTVMSLQTYIISYLNRLIHGLLKITQDVYDKDLKNYTNWPSPPQLLTFFIGDLIRCKYSSQEKEVIRIYKELQTMSHLYPEKFKIVRIKNRLNLGTRDILINAKFQDKILCEIQLAINIQANPFYYCSDKFNHYLYELKRAPLGPVSEMCSIWAAGDQRKKAFEQIISTQRNKKLEDHTCLDEDFVVEKLPFECSQCGRIRYTKKYIIDDLKCNSCKDYWICGYCSINKLKEEELIKKIVPNDEKLFKKIKQRIQSGSLPKYGVFINIESRQIKYNVFKSMKIENQTYVFTVKNDKILLLKQFKTDSKHLEQFHAQNIVFKTSTIRELQHIQMDEIMKEIIIKKYLKSVYKRKRQAINIQDCEIKEEDVLSVDGGIESKRIYSLHISKTELQKIQGLTKRFPSVKFFTVRSNCLTEIVGIGNLKNLQKARLNNNSIQDLPAEFGNCHELRTVSLQNNKIKQIPKQIGNLTKMEEFWIDNNDVQALPDSICELNKLTYLMAPSNKISNIPENIGRLEKLKVLRISTNNLTSIPSSIVQLSNLVLLNLSSNKISYFPPGINKMKNLQRIYLINNELTEFPEGLCDLTGLLDIQFQKNKIKSIPNDIRKLTNLKNLYLNNNNIEKIPQKMNEMKNLRNLSLARNKIKSIPSDFGFIPNLQELAFGFNEISELPENFEKLQKLKILWIQKNEIRRLPDHFCSLMNLQNLVINSNQIQELPPHIQQLEKLKNFHFQGNNIKKIPSQFKNLKNLVNLGIGSSTLHEIPPIIYEMKHIKKLEIDGYGLKQIPEQIFNMDLKELNLHNNEIEEIPDKIEKLKSLKLLRMNKNKLKKVSKKMKNLTNLLELYLQDNLLEDLPKELSALPLRVINISSNKFKHFPSYFSNFNRVRKNFFRFVNNPIEEVECQEYLMERGGLKSRNFLKNWLEKRSYEFEEEDDEDIEQS